MAHICFAAPAIRRFHLHERLARALQSRGHRVTILCPDPVEAAFYSEQGVPALRPPPAPAPSDLPLTEFGMLDRFAAGNREPTAQAARGAGNRLRSVAGSVARFLDQDPPDLILLHQRRTGLHRLIQFLARQRGCRIQWTGDGLLPHTIQRDLEGVDGGSSVCRRRAEEFANVPVADTFLPAALVAAIARNTPIPVARRPVVAPRWSARLAAAYRAFWQPVTRSPWGALRGWHDAQGRPPRPAQPGIDLPRRPFLAVLQQDPRDPRIRLDAPHAPDPGVLVRLAHAAARCIEPDLPLVVVRDRKGPPPPGGLSHTTVRNHTAAPEAAATALAVITVNHPAGLIARIAGTPVLHLGRTPYSIPGSGCIRTGPDYLAQDLMAALEANGGGVGQPDPAAGFLGWLLGFGHIWCCPEHPDHNGINGWVQDIESHMREIGPVGGPLRYRAGPAWPLTAQ